MASNVLNDKANGTRLSRLLVDKGTQVLREAFHDIHPPPTLAAVLNTNKHKLNALRYKVINASQWKLLYPPSGSPDSQNFDVTLLTILLREICGLASPATGWNTMPPDSDTSTEANILRIKLYRNEVYAHITTTEVSDNEFENLWHKISKALTSLGTPSSEVDELKEASLSPEEANYIQELKDWKEAEAELKKISLDTYAAVKEMQALFEKLQEDREHRSHECRNVSKIDKLGKCDFRGDIKNLTKSFQPGTRKWLFDQLDSWFTDKDSESTVMILTAGPGFGKSVFAAKVCEMYAERKQLAACHFIKYNKSDYRNPRMIIESLASNMCENVKGFKAKLEEQLERSHSKDTLSDAFRVLLNDPLHALEECDPMMLVIDALDESEVEGKSDLLELISEEFSKLPQWIKILITSRPELSVQKELKHLNPIEISAADIDNDFDLLYYFWSHLSHICDNGEILWSLVDRCQGSFLFAYYTQMDLKKTRELLTMQNLSELLPKGIPGFYEKQFKRLRDHLHDLAPLKLDLKCFLEVLVAAEGQLPLSMLPGCLGLPDNANYEVRKRFSNIMSSILPVYDDWLYVYHKSVIDWLRSVGYEEHPFTVDSQSGHAHLWQACEKEFNTINKLTTLSDLKVTKMTRYALDYGIYHMIRFGDVTSFFWSVDVKTNHIRTAFYPGDWEQLEYEWKEVLNNPDLSTVLREDLEWHLGTSEKRNSFVYYIEAFYLQCVATRDDFPDRRYDKRETARLLLQEGGYFWVEGHDTTELTKQSQISVLLRAEATCLSVSFDEELVAVGCKDGNISVFQFPEFQEVFTHDTRLKSGVPWCAFSPDKSTLLYGRLDRRLELNTKGELPFFDGARDTLLACSFSPSGHRLVTCDGSDHVKLWDVNNRNLLQSLQAGGGIDCCSFSQSGLFIVGNKEGLKEGFNNQTDVFTVWNALTLQRVDRRNISRNLKYEVTKVSHEEKKTHIVLSRNGDDIDVFELPNALPTARLDGRRYSYLPAVTKYRWRNCILHHDGKNIVITDPVQNTVVAQQKFPFGQQVFPHNTAAIYKVQQFYLVSCSAKLHVFRMVYQPQYDISCCSFSPDGSSLAACVNACPSSICIWDTKLCTVVQTVPLPTICPTDCWWSTDSFWIYDGGLIKLPVANRRTIKTLEGKRLETDWKPLYFLNFSDVLIFTDEDYSTNVVKIIDGELQHVQKLSIGNYVSCAAVSPGNSIIFTANSKEFQIWKEVNTTSLHWVASVTGKLPDLCNLSDDDYLVNRCCITSDSTMGVLPYITWNEEFSAMFRGGVIILVNLSSGEIMKVIENRLGHLDCFFHVSNSCCCFASYFKSHIFVLSLENAEVVAGRLELLFEGPVTAFYSKDNLLAIFSKYKTGLFLKIHAPE